MKSLRLAAFVALAVALAAGWLARELPRGSVEPGARPPVLADAEAGRFDTGGLPDEAVRTLRLIEAGGPFPYDRDGTVFQNREARLPARPRGYYREYTVPTPGARDRGARRIVSGGDPPAEFYYTDDHYRSFRRIEVRHR